MHKTIFSLLITTYVVTASTTATKEKFTIIDAFNAAYKNKKMEAAKENTKSTHEKIVQARAEFLPQISLNASHTRNKSVNTNDTNAPAQFGDQFSKKIGTTLRQNIFNGGATMAAVEGANAQIRKAWADFENTEHDNFKNVAQIFLSILAAQKNVDIAKGNLRFLKKQYESAFEKHKVGEETLTNVTASEAELYKGEAEFEAAAANLSSLKERFAQVTLLSNIEQKEFVSPVAENILPKTEQTAHNQAIDQHYAIKAAIEQLNSAKAQSDQVAGGLLPKIDFSLSANRNENKRKQPVNFQPNRQYSTEFTAQTDLSMPLYEGGQIRSRNREALKQITAAKINLENTKDEVRTAIAEAWIKVKSSEKTFLAFQKVVQAAKKSVDSLTEEQKAGSRTLLDVLQQQQTYFNAQKQLVQTEQEYLQSCYNLLAAMGILTGKKLGLSVEYVDFEKDLKSVKGTF